ncbi:MAG: hypothetical protein ACI8TQ_003608 [Planctomycetota bacterium]|jgi:uncharacterized protein
MNSKATTAATSAPDLESRLLGRIEELGSVAIAFSGGVDSSVLLHAAKRALGERAVAVIADSPSLPRHELAEAKQLADSMNVRLRVVRTDEMDNADYVANRGDRCFFCKWALFDAMQVVADKEDLQFLAFGEITDDLNDDRPGARAAKQRGVVAPLREVGYSKQDVRDYAARYSLSVAAKPASACLASRIPVGTSVSREGLELVERAERSIAELGFKVLRVRNHAPKARLEVGATEFDSAIAKKSEIEDRLLDLGFNEVELAKYGE